MKIDELAARFVVLANKQTLSKAEHAEAQMLMRQLKEAGMANEEISNLSKGRWSSSSVKGYVTGVRATDPSPWQDAANILNEVVNKGISIDAIHSAVDIQDELASAGVTIEDVVSLLAAAKSDGIGIQALIQYHKSLKESNLSLKDLERGLELKKELEGHGLSLQLLPQLAKLAKNFGDVQLVIEAVSKYGTIRELNEELTKTEERLKNVKSELSSDTGCLDEVKVKLSEFKEPLQAYDAVVKLGYSEDELRELAKITEKFGGVKKVFEAIKSYREYADLRNDINRSKTALAEIKAEIARLGEQHSHLKTAIEMCDSLLRNYKFGLDAIATIYSVAQRYGEPINVLKAIEAYEKVQILQQEAIKLESRVAECNKLLVEAEGRYREALNILDSLNAQALKTGQEVGSVQNEFKQSKSIERIMNLLQQPGSASYGEHGPLVLVMAVALKSWVSANEQRFRSADNIKYGLDGLIKDLGGHNGKAS